MNLNYRYYLLFFLALPALIFLIVWDFSDLNYLRKHGRTAHVTVLSWEQAHRSHYRSYNVRDLNGRYTVITDFPLSRGDKLWIIVDPRVKTSHQSHRIGKLNDPYPLLIFYRLGLMGSAFAMITLTASFVFLITTGKSAKKAIKDFNEETPGTELAKNMGIKVGMEILDAENLLSEDYRFVTSRYSEDGNEVLYENKANGIKRIVLVVREKLITEIR
jgi:hypothetical protein